MSTTFETDHSACIVAGVQPLLTELQHSVAVRFHTRDDRERQAYEDFIRDIFQRSYGAELCSFYPNLTAFVSGERIHGVLGYRSATAKPLFCEQYLDDPVERVMGARIGRGIDRRHTVEVGNLALAGFGDARWIIAAMTVFLHSAGYRWVVFTAVKPLFNAFQRLGLRPIQIAVPDPARLADGGRQWGRYYAARPMVCAGDIQAGYAKLSAHVWARQPRLRALLQEARCLGRSIGCNEVPNARKAV